MPELTPSFALQGNDGQSWSLQTERLGLHAVNNVRKLRLQVSPRAGINQSPLESCLGFALPDKPAGSGFGRSNEATAYWLGPNDWLLLDPAQETDRIAGALREAAGGATSVVTNVTDAWSIIEISGEGAVSRLAQGCSVDLHDSVFPAGRYALTRLQHLSVIIHRLDDTPRFRILVDRSVAQYLRDWLVA